MEKYYVYNANSPYIQMENVRVNVINVAKTGVSVQLCMSTCSN